jgi:small subunit ribosomal protein S8
MTVTNYPVGDFLIRVKNAAMARTKTISLDRSNLIKGVAEALKRLGFLDTISEKEGKLEIALMYKSKEPLLSNITLMSKPGLRIYKDASFFQDYKGPSAFIVSTSKGVLTSVEARKENCGGELIAEIV